MARAEGVRNSEEVENSFNTSVAKVVKVYVRIYMAVPDRRHSRSEQLAADTLLAVLRAYAR